jgi:glutamate synthase (NADPH/NADH) small chain
VDRITTSHEEGCEKHFGTLTKKISGNNGKVKKLHLVKVEFLNDNGKQVMKAVQGSEFTIETDLVLLAMGFLGPKKNKLLTELEIELNEKSSIKTDKNKMTNIPKLFVAGDMSQGQSLVVRAMADGKKVAEKVNEFLIKT